MKTSLKSVVQLALISALLVLFAAFIWQFLLDQDWTYAGVCVAVFAGICAAVDWRLA